MKAVFIQAQGGTEVLTYGERPEPSIGLQEVKVRVRACALNRLDIWNRAGRRGTRRTYDRPLILGCDFAGDVAELGEKVTNVQVGQRVVVHPRVTCGRCQYCLVGDDDLCPNTLMLGSTTDGGYAEYAVAPGINAYPFPNAMSYEEAASLPTTFLPAWNIIVRRGQLRPWETALVLSASAGVGVAAIQIAKNVAHARVIATTSSKEKAQKALKLGADHVINYKDEDIEQRVKELTQGDGVDLVVDHVGSAFWEKAYPCLGRNGRYGICGVTTGYQAQIHLGQLFSKNLTLFGVMMGTKQDMRHVMELAARGVIRGVVDHVFPLEEAAKAHELMESTDFFGKILLRIPGG